jgi:hypothetical protein
LSGRRVYVSGLGSIPDLSLHNCQRIRDISALQNNRKLAILDCDNISLSTLNFANVKQLSTDLSLSYAATTTLKAAHSLKFYDVKLCSIFLASTVVSVELHNLHALRTRLYNFSHALKFVLLENISASVDLTPLVNVKKVKICDSSALVNVNGLGNNKAVTIENCENIKDLSALKTVPRVIISGCNEFVNCEDLNQVHYLTIERVFLKMKLSGFKGEKGCRVHRLELLECDRLMSFQGLGEIPFLELTTRHGSFVSLEGDR